MFNLDPNLNKLEDELKLVFVLDECTFSFSQVQAIRA